MSRKANIFNYVITMGATLGTLFAAVYVCGSVYYQTMIQAALKFIVGALIAGLVHTFVHELGHYLLGKKNGFAFSSMTVWFFKWTKVGSKTKFDLVMIGDEAGYTEMIPVGSENLSVRLKKMTSGGIIASFLFMLIGIPAFFVPVNSIWLFAIWVMFLPIGAYFFFGSVLPASSYGARNDGAVLYGLKKKDDETAVTLSLLAVQAEMYAGKSPAEIEEKILFELPQLPEDSLTFLMLLNARYMYYVDKEDYENAKKISQRLDSVIEYAPKGYEYAIKTDLLYNACTFDYDENKADDLVYELEKYLNNVNTVQTVRAKLAYLIRVKRETENIDVFFKKGYKEADRCQIKGLGKYERKLYDGLKASLEENIEE